MSDDVAPWIIWTRMSADFRASIADSKGAFSSAGSFAWWLSCAVLVIVSLLLRLIPGDPVDAMMSGNPGMTQENMDWSATSSD